MSELLEISGSGCDLPQEDVNAVGGFEKPNFPLCVAAHQGNNHNLCFLALEVVTISN